MITEPLTWHVLAENPADLPDCDTTVQIELDPASDYSEPTFMGSLDGDTWRDVHGVEVQVIAWADMPKGTAGVPSSPDWRTKAAAWMRAKADAQERTNRENPRHAEAYPSWETRVRELRWDAEELETGRPWGSAAGDPAVLAALGEQAPEPVQNGAKNIPEIIPPKLSELRGVLRPDQVMPRDDDGVLASPSPPSDCGCVTELKAMLTHPALDFDYKRACQCALYPEDQRCECHFCLSCAAPGVALPRGGQPE